MNVPEPKLEPLPYHFELRDYLKSSERELWNWFSSAQAQADYTENLRQGRIRPRRSLTKQRRIARQKS